MGWRTTDRTKEVRGSRSEESNNDWRPMVNCDYCLVIADDWACNRIMLLLMEGGVISLGGESLKVLVGNNGGTA